MDIRVTEGDRDRDLGSLVPNPVLGPSMSVPPDKKGTVDTLKPVQRITELEVTDVDILTQQPWVDI